MAIGLFLAVIVNQKIRGRTFFRAAFYFPAIASSAAITTLWIFIVSPDGLFNERPGRAGPRTRCSRCFGYRAEPELDRRPGHGAQLGHHPQRLDDVGHVHAVLPGLAPVDQRRGLRGGRDRRRGRVADVPAGSPSRCCGRATTSWRRSRSSARSSCSTRRSSAAASNGDPNNALMTMVLYLYNAGLQAVRLRLRGGRRASSCSCSSSRPRSSSGGSSGRHPGMVRAGR